MGLFDNLTTRRAQRRFTSISQLQASSAGSGMIAYVKSTRTYYIFYTNTAHIQAGGAAVIASSTNSNGHWFGYKGANVYALKDELRQSVINKLQNAVDEPFVSYNKKIEIECCVPDNAHSESTGKRIITPKGKLTIPATSKLVLKAK